jgi:hypothetical protein
MENSDEPRVEVAHIDEQDRLRRFLIARLDAGRHRFKRDESVGDHRT